jgi:hypothetical protein
MPHQHALRRIDAGRDFPQKGFAEGIGRVIERELLETETGVKWRVERYVAECRQRYPLRPPLPRSVDHMPHKRRSDATPAVGGIDCKFTQMEAVAEWRGYGITRRLA